MRILIDLDDTMEDLSTAWCNALNKKYGTSVNPEDVTDWDVTKAFPMLKPEQVYREIFISSFWDNVLPEKDAQTYIKMLQDEGHEIYIVTTTDYKNVKPKYEKIIKKYFPFIAWKNVIITSDKSIIDGDYLIDDGIHNLQKGNFKKILYTKPHNQAYDAKKHGMYRCSSWKEIYNLIKDGEQNKVQKCCNKIKQRLRKEEKIIIHSADCTQFHVFVERLKNKNIKFSIDDDEEEMKLYNIEYYPTLQVGDKFMLPAQAEEWINKQKAK